MAALSKRAGHYIFALQFFFLLSFFFYRLTSAIADWMSTILPHMMWPYCEFRMQVWNVLHAARWKYRTQKSAKIRHLGTIAQLCPTVSSQLRHVSTIGKKSVKQQYVLHMFPQYGELQPTNSWDQFRSLWHPSKFQRVSCLAFVTAATSLNGPQPNYARCMAASCAGTLYIYIYTFSGALAP